MTKASLLGKCPVPVLVFPTSTSLPPAPRLHGTSVLPSSCRCVSTSLWPHSHSHIPLYLRTSPSVSASPLGTCVPAPSHTRIRVLPQRP